MEYTYFDQLCEYLNDHNQFVRANRDHCMIVEAGVSDKDSNTVYFCVTEEGTSPVVYMVKMERLLDELDEFDFNPSDYEDEHHRDEVFMDKLSDLVESASYDHIIFGY